MKKTTFDPRRLYRWCGVALLAGGIIHFTGTDALAAESGWRPIYDNIMLWVNFFILMFVLVKYGRQPFMNFLRGRQEEVADELTRLQERKSEMDVQIQKTRQMVEASAERFRILKDRIIQEGERKKQKIIDDAKIKSRNIIEMEKQKIDHQIVVARNQFMAALVDAAVAVAMNRLPSEIRNEDHQRLLDNFMTGLAATHNHKEINRFSP